MPLFAKPKPPTPPPEEEKKKKKGGRAVTVGAVLFLLAAVTGHGPTTATLSSADTTGDLAGGERAALAGNAIAAWRSVGLTRVGGTVERTSKCAARATGKVRAFLLRTPCASLTEELVALRDGAGNVIVVSIVWVRMSSSANATKLRDVEDTYGTGDIAAISGRAVGLPAVRFTAKHFGSRLVGARLTVAEAEPATGQATGQQADDAAAVAADLPKP
jgi:hypothetical protein